jgi:heptosyltransferase-3
LPEGIFDEIWKYPVGLGWKQVLETSRLFKRQRFDFLYYLMPNRTPRQLWRDRLFFRLAGVPVIGLGLREATALEPPRFLPDSQRYEHETLRLARAIPALRDIGEDAALDLSLHLTPAEHRECADKIGPTRGCTVTISLGTKCDVNHWGLENWKGLVQRLGDFGGIDRLCLIGAADEFDECEAVRKLWRGEAHNLCGQLPARQSAAAIAASQLFIGHDSGPMHMAAAVDVPIVAIFSSRNLPGIWFPLSARQRIHYTNIECMGCSRLRCDDRQKACIRAITVDEVYASCVASLNAELAIQPVLLGAATGRG